MIAPWLQSVSHSPSRALDKGQEAVLSVPVQAQSVRAVPVQGETVRDVPQEQPSPRFFQVVFAVQGQEELRGAWEQPQPERVFQGRRLQVPPSRVPQGVLP